LKSNLLFYVSCSSEETSGDNIKSVTESELTDQNCGSIFEDKEFLKNFVKKPSVEVEGNEKTFKKGRSSLSLNTKDLSSLQNTFSKNKSSTSSSFKVLSTKSTKVNSTPSPNLDKKSVFFK